MDLLPAEMQLLQAGPIYWEINYFWQKLPRILETLAVTDVWLRFINGRAAVSSWLSCFGDGGSVTDQS